MRTEVSGRIEESNDISDSDSDSSNHYYRDTYSTEVFDIIAKCPKCSFYVEYYSIPYNCCSYHEGKSIYDGSFYVCVCEQNIKCDRDESEITCKGCQNAMVKRNKECFNHIV